MWLKSSEIKLRMMTLKELTTLEEMLEHHQVLTHLYPKLSIENYKSMLIKMLPKDYYQVAVFQGSTCIAICGYWLGTKIWCGDYMELDNIVVHSDFRSSGAGKLIFDYLTEKAKKINCNMMSLDSYTSNFKAHKFFYNQGYGPKGFHFVKILNMDGIN